MDHMRPQLFCNDNCPIGAPIIYDQAPPRLRDAKPGVLNAGDQYLCLIQTRHHSG